MPAGLFGLIGEAGLGIGTLILVVILGVILGIAFYLYRKRKKK